MMSAPARRMAVSVSIIDARLVDPAARAGRLDHRVLAAHLIRGGRLAEALFHLRDDVEIGQRRLHHDDVGALGDVDLDLAQRFLDVGRIHLVAAAVAELRRRVGGLAERPVERRSSTSPRTT